MRAAYVLVAVGLAASLFIWHDQRQAPARPHAPNFVPNAISIVNGTPLQGLSTRALTGDALAQTLSTDVLFDDHNTQKFIQYLIQCALPATSTITVTRGQERVDFNGNIGLAPEWETGPCGEACQEWVSACLFARTNVFGVTVRLYLDGEHPAFEGTNDDPYPIEEGAFYGNLFLDPPREYTCRGAGSDPLYLSFRVCTRPGNLCGLHAVGPCSAIDGETGKPSSRHACSSRNARGNFTACRNRMTIEGTDEFPDPSKEYRRIITTTLRKTTFSDGLRAEPCGTEPPDAGVPSEDAGLTPGPVIAGSHCTSDDDCPSDKLFCDTRFPNYMCTGPCNNSSRADYEEADCGGPGSACLDVGATRFCTQACTFGQHPGQMGSCPSGRVCTGAWLQRPTPDDRPGCFSFCSSDQDCVDAPCSARTGSCGFFPPAPADAIADGFPCAIAAPNCRGLCFALVDTSTAGLCGSVINRAVTTSCPDDPSIIRPYSPGNDDLAVCAFRPCRNDGECVAPLRCLNGPAGVPVCTLR